MEIRGEGGPEPRPFPGPRPERILRDTFQFNSGIVFSKFDITIGIWGVHILISILF